MTEEKIDKNTKLSLAVYKHPTFTSLMLTVLRSKSRDDKNPKEIGKASVQIEQKSADWCEIIIKNPRNRNKGIGSKVVKLMIDYMTDWGVKEVNGTITLVDDLEKAANFWEKNGFSVDKETLAQGKATKIRLLINKN